MTGQRNIRAGPVKRKLMPELKLQQSRLDGRFDILECLGRGSYAEIYVARDNAASEGAPETVVIKALNMFLQDAPDEELEHTLIANFQNEAVALDRVRHPNIISRLGHGTAIDLRQHHFSLHRARVSFGRRHGEALPSLRTEH